MKYVWKFEVVNRPSKETKGVTNVSQDFTLKGTVDGEVIAVGSVTKSRGAASYVARDLNDDIVGDFDTRSQAAHALRKHRVAKATETTEPETTETEPETTETEPETTETEPEIVEPETTETESTEGDLGGEAA